MPYEPFNAEREPDDSPPTRWAGLALITLILGFLLLLYLLGVL